MKKAIATTTIYPPSKALLLFIEIAERDDWKIFIAGDLKTPNADYLALQDKHPHVFQYLDPSTQDKMDHELSEAIGWHSIQRRNFAFLAAHKWGAEVLASVDDDNIPMSNWGQELMLGTRTEVRLITDATGFCDPIAAAGRFELWHRGFPIQLVSARNHTWTVGEGSADIQADFWNGDPDVDAICRMIHAPTNMVFHTSKFPFATRQPTVFNSQNTFLRREVIPHYFVFPHVGRADDIWACFYAQAQGFRVAFGKPSVIQQRNPQDVMKNFFDEQLNYRHNLEIMQRIADGEKDAVLHYLPERTRYAFDLYQKHFEL